MTARPSRARETGPCKRCGGLFARTPSGHIRAHECPHGAQCVVPYERRRVGEKAEHCTQCSGAPDTRLDPGQMPLPFQRGIRAQLRRRRKREVWREPMGRAHTCPACGCGQDVRCTITLEGGGLATCVPAGIYGRKVCSACRQPSLPGIDGTKTPDT